MSALKHDFQQSTKGEVVKKQQKTQKKSQHVDDQLDGKKMREDKKSATLVKLDFQRSKNLVGWADFYALGFKLHLCHPDRFLLQYWCDIERNMQNKGDNSPEKNPGKWSDLIKNLFLGATNGKGLYVSTPPFILYARLCIISFVILASLFPWV